MGNRTTIRLLTPTEVVLLEVDDLDIDDPQYINLSDSKREVYHYSGRDQNGNLLYELKGTEERQYPDVSGGK